MNPFNDLIHHHVYRGGELPPLATHAYDYILAGNGLFKRARDWRITALVPVASLRVVGLPDLSPVLQVRPGRIPDRLLRTVLGDARRHARAGREQLYQFHANGQRISLTRPAQHATGAKIAYRLDEQRGLLCDLHSHHTMPAYFSPTDNRDELGFCFYAVIGNVLERPEILLRLGIHGDLVYVPATALFTGLGPFVDTYEEVQ